MPVSLQLQLGHLFREVKFPECKIYDECHELCIQETLLREIDYPVCPKIVSKNSDNIPWWQKTLE